MPERTPKAARRARDRSPKYSRHLHHFIVQGSPRKAGVPSDSKGFGLFCPKSSDVSCCNPRAGLGAIPGSDAGTNIGEANGPKGERHDGASPPVMSITRDAVHPKPIQERFTRETGG